MTTIKLNIEEQAMVHNLAQKITGNNLGLNIVGELEKMKLNNKDSKSFIKTFKEKIVLKTSENIKE